MTHDPPAHPSGAERADAAAGADELFAHGLLSVVHEATEQPREGRVRRVMEVLDRPARRGSSPRRRLPRLVGAGTVLSAAVAAIVFLVSPVTTPTYASFEESINVLRGPGDRRYQITAAFGPADQPEDGPHASIDTRFPHLMLLRVKKPDGHEVIAGRDQTGEWAITPTGEVDRTNPRRAWPGWAMQEGESFFADSIDSWLEAAAASYTFGEPDRRPLPGHEAAGALDHMVGVRKPSPGPMAQRLRSADRIELWIDPSTKVLERMEMLWKPRLLLPAEDAPPRHGPRPFEEGGLTEPGEPGPPANPPGGPELYDDAPPGHAADIGEGPPGPPRRFDGPRPPDRPWPRGPAPQAPDGPGRRGGPLAGPAGGTPNGPLGSPRRLPLRRLIIERTEAPAFDAHWFSPQAHGAIAHGTDTGR